MLPRRHEFIAVIALVVAVLALVVGLRPGTFASAAGPAGPDGPTAVAAIPSTLNYQGVLRLADGSLANDAYNITIKLYDAAVGGNELHSETFNNVAVRDGLFKVVLGDSVAIAPTVFADAPRFVGITVAPDPEMVPRQRLHPVPWAQQATTAFTATTLVPNAIVPSFKMTGYNALRIDGPPDEQFAPYLSLGQYGGFMIDSPGVTGGRFVVSQNGNVGIGDPNPANKLTVNGAVRASGKVIAAQGFNGKCAEGIWNFAGVGPNIHVTCNQDVAETFATTEQTEPGDLVVMLHPSRAGTRSAPTYPAVRLSAGAYESGLVGVVSTNPGLVFDQGHTYLAGENTNLITADKTVVAMIGRVPVKVSLENGPIRVGDPLTSSSIRGAAMKATQAGQIVGYAMQSSDEMVDGKLLAWLQVGYYLPSQLVAALNDGSTTVQAVAALTEQNTALAQQVAALQAENAALKTADTVRQAQFTTLDTRLAALERQTQPASATGGFSPQAARHLATIGVE